MTVEARELPSMSSPLWDDPQIVLALAGVEQADVDYWLGTVSPAAHAIAHPQPVYGCLGCPACPDPGDRSAEPFWWKRAVA